MESGGSKLDQIIIKVKESAVFRPVRASRFGGTET